MTKVNVVHSGSWARLVSLAGSTGSYRFRAGAWHVPVGSSQPRSLTRWVPPTCAKNAHMALPSHREGSSNANRVDKASTKIRLASLLASAAPWASTRSEFGVFVIPLSCMGILATATLGV